MKQITLIFGEGFDQIVSVTAIGRSETTTNVSTKAFEVKSGETLYFPLTIKPAQMTNYERIKAMSIEEMAQFITDEKPFCTLNECDCIYGWHDSDCEKHAKEWLQSEADDN